MNSFKVILICFFMAASSYPAVDLSSILRDAEAYEKYGDYDAAALEYRRALFLYQDHRQSGALQRRLALALSASGRYEEALSVAESVPFRFLTDSLRADLLLDQKYYCLRSGQYRPTVKRLDSSGTGPLLQDANHERALLDGFCRLQMNDWKGARMVFREYFKNDSSLLTRYNHWLDTVTVPAYKDAGIARILSMCCPGIGQAYAGEYGDAVNAAMVNAGTGYFLVQSLIDLQWVDAGLLGFFFWRFYRGNRDNAAMEARAFNARNLQSFRERYYRLLAVLILDKPRS